MIVWGRLHAKVGRCRDIFAVNFFRAGDDPTKFFEGRQTAYSAVFSLEKLAGYSSMGATPCESNSQREFWALVLQSGAKEGIIWQF